MDLSVGYLSGFLCKGDKHNPSNYRPISLTCIACKLLEHIFAGKTPTDKSNAIKTFINFLSFVKPLKTGTNYPPDITQNTTTALDLSVGVFPAKICSSNLQAMHVRDIGL
jgi:hypothetical protein